MTSKNVPQISFPKVIRTIIPLCIAAILCGCSGNSESVSEKSDVQASSVASSDHEITVDDQLMTFYNTREQWEIVDGQYDNGAEGIEFTGGYSYAVTDIDEDGNLEILMSGVAGTGHYSTNVFYEFSGIDKIEKMDTSGFGIDESEPDISEDYLAGFVDYQGETSYLFKDYQGYGAGCGRINYYSVSVKENSFSTNLIGFVVYYDDSTSYYDKEGKLISLNSFNIKLNGAFREEKFKSIFRFSNITPDNLRASYDGISEYKDHTLDDFKIKSTSDLNEELSDGGSITVDDSVLDYSDIDPQTKNMYKAFLGNETDAIIMSSCIDTTNDKWFSTAFSEGKKCSIKEIKSKCAESVSLPYGDKTIGRYMDCGMDGNYEFLVEMNVPNNCKTYIVLKAINDKIYICYVGDEMERKAIYFKENGVLGYMVNANGTLHYGNDYFIDADGVCHFFEYTGIDAIHDDTLCSDYPDSVLVSNNVDSLSFSFTSFSEDESSPTYLHDMVISTDDGYIDQNDENEELFAEAERIFADKGYIVLSDEEAEEKFKEGREKVGLKQEIYDAEVAYYY